MKKIILILVVLSLFSCTTTVSSLKSNPSKYAGKIVSIKGNVQKVISIPFTDFAVYELADSNSDIILFSGKKYNKGSNITLNVEVVGFDGKNESESAKNVIKNIETFLLKNSDLKKSDVTNISKNVSSVITKFLITVNGSYFLIDKSGN